ncbi:MAG: 2-oxoglutarate ferredoxin oxidoreductase subunit beta, partial [Selenomonas artemidis]
PAAMLSWMRDHAVMKSAWDKLPPEKRTPDKFPIGLLYSCEGAEYGAANTEIMRRAGGL